MLRKKEVAATEAGGLLAGLALAIWAFRRYLRAPQRRRRWHALLLRVPGIAGLLAVFFLSLAGIPPLAGGFAMHAVRRAMGSGQQVARVHGIAMFLLLCAVYPANALLPALALVLPAWFHPPLRQGRTALAWVGALALILVRRRMRAPATSKER